MELGAFSVSPSVRDLTTSRAFYEKLGFVVFHDASEMSYLIMQNADRSRRECDLLDQHVPRPGA